MAVISALKQPEEKSAQRDPSIGGWACYYCRKVEHLKQNCSQVSKPLLAPCLICKGPHWRRHCPQRYRPQGSDSQDNQDLRSPGVPTQAAILITFEEPWVIITVGGQSVSFLLDTKANYSVLTESPWLTFHPIYYCNGAVWMSQTLFQSSSKLQLGLCSIFS